jgi:hypothetical protein
MVALKSAGVGVREICAGNGPSTLAIDHTKSSLNASATVVLSFVCLIFFGNAFLFCNKLFWQQCAQKLLANSSYRKLSLQTGRQ